MVYISSDLHLGHKSITKYRTQFHSMEEHDNYFIDLILSLTKRDVLIILGDFLFDGPHYDEYIQRLSAKKCRIKLIMGNHDSMKLYSEPIFEVQLPLYSYKNFWLSHCPIHPDELRGRIANIHGHTHYNPILMDDELGTSMITNPNYFSVCPEVNNYQFVNLESIKEVYDILPISNS